MSGNFYHPLVEYYSLPFAFSTCREIRLKLNHAVLELLTEPLSAFSCADMH